jgi:ribosomal protein S18 acetylase RimI-like enzyme
MSHGRIVPRSLVHATGLDVLPPDRVVERRHDHVVVRSPGSPEFYWGNFILFDDAPGEGDRARWEALFDETFADEPRVRHRAFAWDRPDGRLGAARQELEPRGYRLNETVGLVAEAGAVRPHERGNREVEIRALDTFGDEELWAGVVEVQVAGRDAVFEDEAAYRAFSRRRQAEWRRLFELGRGTWYVALLPGTTEIAGSCGVVVTDGRGRYQAVDTALAHRRRGICSTLVVEAARLSTEAFGTERFVIVADAGYHALGLYESLGFTRRERAADALLLPRR